MPGWTPPIISEDIYDFSHLLEKNKSPDGGLIYSSSRRSSPGLDDFESTAMSALFPPIVDSRLVKTPGMEDKRDRQSSIVVYNKDPRPWGPTMEAAHSLESRNYAYREPNIAAAHSETSAYREPKTDRNQTRRNYTCEQKAQMASASYVFNGTDLKDIKNAKAISTVPWHKQRQVHADQAVERVHRNYVNVKPATIQSDRVTYDSTGHSIIANTRPPLPPCTTDKPKSEWELEHLRRSRRANQRIQQEYVDELRIINLPNEELLNDNTSPQNEIELDRKRQVLLDRKRREAKALKKKKECADVAAKGGVVQGPLYTIPAVQHLPTPPKATTAFTPHAPTAPLSQSNVDGSYSKRKRKLRVKGQHSQIEREGRQIEIADQTVYEDVQGTPPACSASVMSSSHQHAQMQTSIAGQNSVNKYSYFDIDTDFRPTTAALANCNTATSQSTTLSAAYVPMIPHQSSQPLKSWNGETAKRGLGFKSKLRRDAEEASAKVEAAKEVEAAKQMSNDARIKWRKATFRQN